MKMLKIIHYIVGGTGGIDGGGGGVSMAKICEISGSSLANTQLFPPTLYI